MTGLLTPALAQDAALVERVNQLSAYVQDLLETKVEQQQQIISLEREVESLRRELERTSGGASREDVVAVADAVKQLEQKHRADIELIAIQIEKLGKTPSPAPAADHGTSSAQGWEYTILQGNTISAIANAYRAEGVKVTVDDILKANPGLDPKRLKVGDVIFIPEP